MRHRGRVPGLLAVTAALAVACGGGMGGDGMGGDGTSPHGMDDAMGGGMDGGMDDATGGGMDNALGGSARTDTLAQVTVEELPDGPLAWSAFEVEDVEHRHAGGFVHAREDTTLTLDGEERSLRAGEAAYVAADVAHTHGDGTSWDVLLAAPDVAPPDGATGGTLFTSGELVGVPETPVELHAVLVELAPGSSTSVHIHPGPEFIHVTEGSFVYENDRVGSLETGKGDGHAIGPDVPVQKRNPEDGGDAAFLSWFVVDPDEPFASEASFGG